MNGYDDSQLLDALFVLCDQKAAADMNPPPYCLFRKVH
jgi:hypothetical protein